MRVLVCGGRYYGREIDGEKDPALAVVERARLNAVLDDLHAHTPIVVMINGAAPGADRFAAQWANRHAAVTLNLYRADWKRYGLGAGPKRNQEMLEQGRPDLVVAFPGGPGTRDMCSRAEAAGVRVVRIDFA